MVIRASNISHSFGSQPVLFRVSFTIADGEKIGLVGPNGSGKTTLLRILVRELQPDMGEVVILGSPEIGYLPQQVPVRESTTVRSLLFGELERLEKIMAQLRREIGSDPDGEAALVKLEALEEELRSRFGPDYRARAREALARLGFTPARHKLKITSLSPAERYRLELARTLIQHPDVLILDDPTSFLDIEQREWLEKLLREFTGAVLVVSHDRVFLNRIANRVFELRQGRLKIYEGDYDDYERQRPQEEIRKQRTEKSPSLNPRTTALKRPLRHSKSTDRPALLANGLVKKFGRRAVIGPASLEVRAKEKVGLIGPSGSGKTVLLQMLVGELKPDRGTVDIAPGLRIGYLPQNITAHEQSRLTQLLSDNPDLLILDEPAAHLDIDGLVALEKMLGQFAGGILFTTCDRALLVNLAERVLELRDGRLKELPGRYS